MATVGELLADFAAGLQWEDVPEGLRDFTRWRVADTVGLCLAAWGEPFALPVLSLARRNAARRAARLLGTGESVGPLSAVLVHGCLAHGLDFDDTHPESVVHPSSTIVPVALAVGEELKRSGAEILAAVAAGAEIMCRLGAAAGRSFHARGFHASGVVGPLAAAVTAGSLMRLEPPVLTRALGLAASFGGGLLEFLEDGSWSKRIHPGWAAHSGIAAAELAAEGFSGPATALEGRYGLYAAFLAGAHTDLRRISEDLGTSWESEATSFKLYPCAHVIQPFLDALFQVMEEDRVTSNRVASVTCDVEPWQIEIVCEPREGKVNPGGEYQARTSLPLAVALALLDGRVDISSFEPESFRRPELRDLARRVECRLAEPGGPADSSNRFGTRGFYGRVSVVLDDGRQLSAQAGGEPGGLPAQALADKFLRNVSRHLAPERAHSLLQAIQSLDRAAGVGEVFQLTVPDGGGTPATDVAKMVEPVGGKSP